MYHLTYHARKLLFSIGLFLCIFGCNSSDRPDLGRVQGKVTIDGKPMDGYTISFSPETGRPSFSIIDPEGHYDLNYVMFDKGAKVGASKVRIWWVDDGDPATTAAPIAGIEIPDKYSLGQEVTVEVVSGENTFDFELQSK